MKKRKKQKLTKEATNSAIFEKKVVIPRLAKENPNA